MFRSTLLSFVMAGGRSFIFLVMFTSFILPPLRETGVKRRTSSPRPRCHTQLATKVDQDLLMSLVDDAVDLVLELHCCTGPS